MAIEKVSPPLRYEPASAEAWGRFLEERVVAGFRAFSGGLRADALHMAKELERQLRHGLWSLAVALSEARRHGLDRPGLLELHARIQATPPELLQADVGVRPAVIGKGTSLLSKGKELVRVAAKAGVGDLVVGYREQLAQAELLGRSALRQASVEEQHLRVLIEKQPVPFRTLAFYDRGDGASRVLLSLCLLHGIRLPEEAVPFIATKVPGEGRSRTRPGGLVEAFLRVLPPSGEEPGDLVVHHAGPLGRRMRSKAYRAAANAIGIEYVPGRGELLVRLLAASGEETCTSALSDDLRWQETVRRPNALGDEETRPPRHGPVLTARIKAVERQCLRFLQGAESTWGEPVPFSSLELALRRSGQLLRKDWVPPVSGMSEGGSSWILADLRGEDGEEHPPPQRG